MGIRMGERTKLGGQAVVVGSGIAGLFAARVLSDHFDHVTVVDRDHEPKNAEVRSAVPQGNHFHILLPGGLDAIRGWFDGIVDDLIESGSVELMLGRDFYAYTTEGKSYSLQIHRPDPVDGEMTYVQTRPQLEMNVRNRVESLPNVSFRYRSLVDGPLITDGHIAGVTIRGGEAVSADLVVDASGRNSFTARWLTDLGYNPAPETYINCDVNYTSVIVRPENWDAFEGSVIFFMPSGEGEHASHGGAIVKLAGDRWLLTLTNRYSDAPPTNWDGYRKFGKTLVHPIWDGLVTASNPRGPIKTYRLKRVVRHHYEQLDRFPEGLVPVGDAVCFFNPTYGQGMSSAAGQCRALEEILDARVAGGQDLNGVAMDFFPSAAEWVRGPWAIAAASDFGNSKCTGDFPVDDLPDLERLGRLAETGEPDSPEIALVSDIMVLREPLSAVNRLTT